MLCLAVALLIVNTVYRLAINLQAFLRCLEQVGKCPVLVLVKAAAAGVAAVLCTFSVYHDGLLAAAVVRVVNTILYITIQFYVYQMS